MEIGESSSHLFGTTNIFLASEVSTFYVAMQCIPCCGPELGVSLAVEGVLSLVGVLCFPVV